MLEPVIGTLFIAIFISRLVGIAGNKEKQPAQLTNVTKA
jgi:hypothetical protein